MDTLLQDLRYGLRRLAKSPGFTSVAMLTLALGIGANSAIFSVVNAVLFQPLPYPEPDRLVRVFHLGRDGDRSTMSVPNFLDVRAQTRTMESVSFWGWESATLTGRGEPVRLDGAQVGSDFFQVLGMQPALGRVFRAEENEPGRHRVAVLSHAAWKNRFGGAPSVVGATITLNGEPFEVVGVMPEGFDYPSKREIWRPMEYTSSLTGEDARGAWFISGIGRLRPGATTAEAAREVGTIAKRLEKAYPEVNSRLGMTVVSLYEVMVGDVRTALLVMLGAVGFVLLIACANVANLMLARAAGRESELAVRTALGAGRTRLVRQLLTESVILSVAGGAAGLLLAVWGTAALVALRPEGIPRLDEVGVNGTVTAFTAGLAVLTGLLFGLFPALQATGGRLAGALREGGRGTLSGRSGSRVRSALVAVEMTLAVVLLAGAGLLVRSFLELRSVEPGFRSEGALTFHINLPEAGYSDQAVRWSLYERLLERIRGVPGVVSAGGVSAAPMSGSVTMLTFEVSGRERARPGEAPVLHLLAATPDYLRTIGVPLVRGRAIGEQDRAGSQSVAMLTESAARKYFAGEDPIGRRITFDDITGDEEVTWHEVVGVVGDVRHFGLNEPIEPGIYLSQTQNATPALDVVVRTSVPPLSIVQAIRRELDELDRNLPIVDARPLEQNIDESVSQPRFYMILLTLFAGVALVLATIGIFGVVSYAMAQRTREIGIRMALGASAAQVLGLVTRQGMTPIALGGAAGVVVAAGATRFIRGMLFEVPAYDPWTFGGVLLVLMTTGFLASYLPARRAIRVDPMVALRTE